jgi:hypothetical protein
MTAKVIEFPSGAALAPPIAQFIRIGDAHNKLGELVGMDRFPASRVVLQASRLAKQRRLMELLRPLGVEFVLDPQIAELASVQKYRGQERHAPWGSLCEQAPLGPQFFTPNAPGDVIGQIARTAVSHGFHVVLSPTHYLGDPNFPDWLSVDRNSCIALRAALDREGGGHIRIDYPVLHAHTALHKNEVRSAILEALGDLPIDNVWFRASGAEGTAGPETTRRFLNSLAGFHNAGRPIVLDCLGGMLSLAAIAFGMASGRSLGIGELERFDANEWHKEPKQRDEESAAFARTVRVAIPELGRTLTRNEVLLLSEAHGGKKLLAGHLRGVTELIADSREHQLRQLAQDITALEAVPMLRRDDWFLRNTMAATVRKSRIISQLKPPAARAEALKIDPTQLMRRLVEHAQCMQKVQVTLEVIQQGRSDDAPRARPAAPPRLITEVKRRDSR